MKKQLFIALLIVAAVFSTTALVEAATSPDPAAPVVTSVQLGWFNGRLYFEQYAGDADSLRIYYKKTSDSVWVLNPSNIPPTASDAYIAAFEQLTSYDFYMTAVKNGVESEPSNIVTGTTARKPRI